MKKILLFILTISVFTASAQDTTKKAKTYHNEFGIDATGFVKQFINFNQGQSGGNYYVPSYYITYRRLLKKGNIRFAVGGDFQSEDLQPGFQQDSNKYHKNSYSIDARIGWEFFSNMSKRWQIFYGVDFKPTFSYTKNDAQYWNGGYANGSESKTEIYGIAPLLGFRFKLNDRISLTTETSYSINIATSSGKRYYIPVTGQYPPLPDVESPRTKKIYSNFSQPVSVVFTFNI